MIPINQELLVNELLDAEGRLLFEVFLALAVENKRTSDGVCLIVPFWMSRATPYSSYSNDGFKRSTSSSRSGNVMCDGLLVVRQAFSPET